MLDPLSAIATHAGIKFVDRLLNAPSPAAADIVDTAKVTTKASANASVEKTLSSTLSKDLQKFLAENPSIKAQLGDGPYTLSLEGKTLKLSSPASGQSVTLDNSSLFGQKAELLAQWTGSKIFQKGLELQGV